MAVAALITWVVTAGLGFYMLRTWISNGGARDSGSSHFRPPVVFGHFLLAAGGLVLWVVYVVNDSRALAWVAFADLLVVAVLGDLLVYRWTKDRRGAGAPASSAGNQGAAGDTMTVGAREVGAVRLAEQRIPTPAVALHGVVAVTTVVLVLLSALGVGQ